jgi:hypothetical protein
MERMVAYLSGIDKDLPSCRSGGYVQAASGVQLCESGVEFYRFSRNDTQLPGLGGISLFGEKQLVIPCIQVQSQRRAAGWFAFYRYAYLFGIDAVDGNWGESFAQTYFKGL